MNFSDIDQDAVRTASFLAYKLTYSKIFEYYEREDIMQELIIDYLLKKEKYDPLRGELKTFINVVMVNKAKDLAAIKKKHNRLFFSSIEDIKDFDIQYHVDPCNEEVENTFDAANILGFLSDEEKAFCLSIMKGLSVRQVCKEFNITQPKYYRRLKKIKNILSKA